MVKEKVTSVEFPDIEDFFVDICYINKEKMAKLRTQCLENRYNKRSRQTEEIVNQDKFIELYTSTIVRGWRGLTMRKLAQLLPIEVDPKDLDVEVPYDKEDALALIQNSTMFDQFVSDTLNNFDVFEKEKAEESTKN